MTLSTHLRENVLMLCLLALATTIGLLTPFFWTAENLSNVLSQAAIPALLALGACLVIGSGQIDLSVGSVLALAGLVTGVVANSTGSFLAGILAGIALGGACGIFNGLLAAWIPSFVVTLATMVAFRGVALGLTQSHAVNLLDAPPLLSAYGVPWLAVIAGASAGAILYLVRRTRFGLNVLATGSNEAAAWNLGIDTRLVRTGCFGIAGAIAGMGGALLTLRLGSARPTAGAGYELDAITAAIVGGAALTGGKVSITGAVTATVLFSMIRNSLTLLDVTPASQQVLIGGMLILVVLTRTLGLAKVSA